jgi:hypothetical protein
MIEDAFRINNIRGRYVPSKIPFTYHLSLPDKTTLAFTKPDKGSAYNAAVAYCKRHEEFLRDPARKQHNYGRYMWFKEKEMVMMLAYLPEIPNTTKIIKKIKENLNVLHNRCHTTIS